jgi:hypothetical protein
MIVSIMIRRLQLLGCGTALRSSSSEIVRVVVQLSEALQVKLLGMWYSC